jgi:hypothetical protein
VIFLLGAWRSHADYQKFMIEHVNREFKRNPKSIATFESAILKIHLDALVKFGSVSLDSFISWFFIARLVFLLVTASLFAMRFFLLFSSLFSSPYGYLFP